MATRPDLREISGDPPMPPDTVGRHGGAGNGGNLGERLARLEAHMEHLATKADVEALKTVLVEAIGKKETSMLRWQIGIVVTTALILVVAAVVSKLP